MDVGVRSGGMAAAAIWTRVRKPTVSGHAPRRAVVKPHFRLQPHYKLKPL